MNRLALAVGFLAVFGFVAFVLSAMIIKSFERSNKAKKEEDNTTRHQ